MKKIVFVSGTRADFSKMKSLMLRVEETAGFDLCIFATGMHLSKNFGYTVREIEKCNFKQIFKFINHDKHYQMDLALASTIDGFSKFITEYEPDLIVVHGDRIEPLAASIVGALNNILVAHIEGGELSGTIDDSIRHSISKLAHIHLVNDHLAKRRLLQLGEAEASIFVIGSPDLDILRESSIDIGEAKRYYDIDFDSYAIAIFHPVTTEYDSLREQAWQFCKALEKSQRNYLVIYPNNDLGFRIILECYQELRGNSRFRFFPSLRFEYFISLLKHAEFIVGNSSCTLKEASFFNLPGINVGSRQDNRLGRDAPNIFNTPSRQTEILKAIESALAYRRNSPPTPMRSEGKNSSERFYELLTSGVFFGISKQKRFKDAK